LRQVLQSHRAAGAISPNNQNGDSPGSFTHRVVGGDKRKGAGRIFVIEQQGSRAGLRPQRSSQWHIGASQEKRVELPGNRQVKTKGAVAVFDRVIMNVHPGIVKGTRLLDFRQDRARVGVIAPPNAIAQHSGIRAPGRPPGRAVNRKAIG